MLHNTTRKSKAESREEVRIEEQKEQRAKIEAEQTSAIEAAKQPHDTAHDAIRKDDDRTVSRTSTGTSA